MAYFCPSNKEVVNFLNSNILDENPAEEKVVDQFFIEQILILVMYFQHIYTNNKTSINLTKDVNTNY